MYSISSETKTQNTFINDKQRSPPKFNLIVLGLKWLSGSLKSERRTKL